MKENKKLNKVLTIIILVCLLGAFIISVAARMYDNVLDHYKHMTTSSRPNPYWAVYAPFMVLCVAAAVLAIIKFVRVIKVNKSNLGKNKVAIAAIIIEAAIIILAIIACISFTMWPKFIDIAESQAFAFLDGTMKMIPSVVTSALGFALAGVDCGLSFAKLDK